MSIKIIEPTFKIITIEGEGFTYEFTCDHWKGVQRRKKLFGVRNEAKAAAKKFQKIWKQHAKQIETTGRPFNIMAAYSSQFEHLTKQIELEDC